MSIKKVKKMYVLILYSVVSSLLDYSKRFYYTSPAGRLVHSDTNLTSPGSI